MTQIDYAAILLSDCGFVTLKQRNAYLTRECGRKVKYLDELDKKELSTLIDILKVRKARMAADAVAAVEDDDYEEEYDD